ncbi:MAG TPA: pyridoxamine 5'-phosphate oxidase family protein [Thermoleophilaceae bacterium]|nr:pyridoxamine 5'-phosphate oxidase family protein [Thermoleophilaceae bacterium]
MTASLPEDVQRVFETFITTEYTTVDRRGQPISWPVTPYYRRGGPCIDVSTGLGYPKKAKDARRNPKVALLFSDPTGCGMESPPQVLVQGSAQVDDEDLDANRDRYRRESMEKLPKFTEKMMPPKAVQSLFDWYYKRIYVHVRPERVYVWPEGDSTREPQLFDAHMEEVRSGHDEEPPGQHAGAEGGAMVWDQRMDELGERYPSAVLSLVAPDGFPFSVRVPISVDRAGRRLRVGAGVLGLPIQPGLACLTAHDHHPEFLWQRNFQVRGDLVEDDGGWAVIPHRMIGGFESPPSSALAVYRLNARKFLRYRKHAKRELRERAR